MPFDRHDAQLTWASERHLRLSLGSPDAPQTRLKVHRVAAALLRAPLPGLISITPAYNTILLEFAPHRLDEAALATAVSRVATDAADGAAEATPRVVEIPVCYESPCAPDGEDVARSHGLGLRELVRFHTAPLYTVHFLGFAPGFGYLGGLDPRLATPRLPVPRVRVPVGSVGIAGDQTGIYATPGAGGWRLIGRTPLVMFDARRDPPALLAAGDRVRFVPIGYAEFQAHPGEPR